MRTLAFGFWQSCLLASQVDFCFIQHQRCHLHKIPCSYDQTKPLNSHRVNPGCARPHWRAHTPGMWPNLMSKLSFRDCVMVTKTPKRLVEGFFFLFLWRISEWSRILHQLQQKKPHLFKDRTGSKHPLWLIPRDKGIFTLWKPVQYPPPCPIHKTYITHGGSFMS